MIDKLIIGPWRHEEEIKSPHEAPPAEIVAWVEEVEYQRAPGAVSICTYSPMVIYAVEMLWQQSSTYDFERFVIRPEHGPDVPLLSIRDASWLAHFSIANLYMRGELTLRS